MGSLRMVNLGVEALSLVICAVLLLQLCVIRGRRNTDRWLKLALLCNIFMLLGDMSDWGLSGTHWPWSRALVTAGGVLVFSAGGMVMYCFFAYLVTYLDDRQPRSRLLLPLMLIPAAVELVLAASSPLTGLIFRVTAENAYVRGPLFVLSHIPPCLTFLAAFLTFLKGWKVLSRRERRYYLLYLALPFTAEIIQLLFYSVALLPVSLTLTFLLAYSFINAELDQKVLAYDKQLEEERLKTLRAVQARQHDLTAEVILALGNAVEAKDRYTNGHAQRVALYAREIARRLGWGAEDQDRVYYAGLLHDVGKIRVPDAIINKPGRLTEAEYAEIKLHTTAGYYILKEISSVHDFAMGARWHHERWDGKGYPNGLKGENIPLIARIIGVADAYDAMTSNRIYRPVMSQEQVRAEIRQGAWSQFDPHIAAIMLEMIDEDTDYRMRQSTRQEEFTILAIDDAPMVHKQLELFLGGQARYHLVSRASGEEGIAWLEENRADLVLLDVEMHGMNGFDVLSWIRENRAGLPVIFTTGDKTFSLIQQAEQLGVNDYLTKPLSAPVLLDSIENVLFRSRFRIDAEIPGQPQLPTETKEPSR